MSLPYSRSQIEQLGKRLIASAVPDPPDVQQLNLLLLAYRDVLNDVVGRVESATGLRGSSRIKTRATTLDKLRRQGGSWLKSMQDLAGMRLVVGPSRAEQDRVVAQIVAEFAGGRREPEIVDRRSAPMHGYRAVHVIVFLDDARVEVQVRTALQHEWAEAFEKFADRVGRGVRYGLGVEPLPNETPLRNERMARRERVYEQLMSIGELVEQLELLPLTSDAERVEMESDFRKLLRSYEPLIEEL